jgi:hypothetical protein
LAEGRDDQGGAGGASWSSAGVPLDGSEELLSWEGRRRQRAGLSEEERSAGEPGAISGPEVCRIPAQVCLEISFQGNVLHFHQHWFIPDVVCSVIKKIMKRMK